MWKVQKIQKWSSLAWAERTMLPMNKSILEKQIIICAKEALSKQCINETTVWHVNETIVYAKFYSLQKYFIQLEERSHGLMEFFSYTKLYMFCIFPAQNQHNNIKTKCSSNVIVLLCTAETEREQSLMRTLAQTNFKSFKV